MIFGPKLGKWTLAIANLLLYV